MSVWVNHRDTEITEQTLLLPDRETAIGQELRPPANLLSALDPKMPAGSEGKSLSPSGDASFPWPSSPGQGKQNLLCDLCASVVKKSAGFSDHPILKYFSTSIIARSIGSSPTT
jgi:hypothetical protein